MRERLRQPERNAPNSLLGGKMSEEPTNPPPQQPDTSQLTDEERSKFAKFLDEWLNQGAENQPTPKPIAAGTPQPATSAPSTPAQAQPSATALPSDFRTVISSILDERDSKNRTDSKISELESKIKELEGKVGARRVRAWFSPLFE